MIVPYEQRLVVYFYRTDFRLGTSSESAVKSDILSFNNSIKSSGIA